MVTRQELLDAGYTDMPFGWMGHPRSQDMLRSLARVLASRMRAAATNLEAAADNLDLGLILSVLDLMHGRISVIEEGLLQVFSPNPDLIGTRWAKEQDNRTWQAISAAEKETDGHAPDVNIEATIAALLDGQG